MFSNTQQLPLHCGFFSFFSPKSLADFLLCPAIRPLSHSPFLSLWMLHFFRSLCYFKKMSGIDAFLPGFLISFSFSHLESANKTKLKHMNSKAENF